MIAWDCQTRNSGQFAVSHPVIEIILVWITMEHYSGVHKQILNIKTMLIYLYGVILLETICI